MRGCRDHVHKQCDFKQQYYFHPAAKIQVYRCQEISHDFVNDKYLHYRPFFEHDYISLGSNVQENFLTLIVQVISQICCLNCFTHYECQVML